MIKSDLKNGMVVELRNGRRLLVMDNLLFDKKFIKEVELNDFTDTLIYIGLNKEFDIIKVYKDVRAFIETNCKPIWKREEVDWSKVPVDTKVLVSNSDKNGLDFEDSFVRRYFAKYENGMFYTYAQGTDSWTSESYCYSLVPWKYCKLAEEPKEKVTKEELKEEYLDFMEPEFNGYECDEEEIECLTEWLLDNYNVTRK